MICCSGECILKPIIGQNDRTKYAHEGTLAHHFAKFKGLRLVEATTFHLGLGN